MVIAVSAMALAIYNTVSLSKADNKIDETIDAASKLLAQLSTQSSGAIALAQMDKSGNMLSMKEFSNLDPELKSMYDQLVVKKLAPAAIKVINAEWNANTQAQKQKIRQEATMMSNEAARFIESQVKMARKGMPINKPAIIRATLAPIRQMTKEFKPSRRETRMPPTRAPTRVPTRRVLATPMATSQSIKNPVRTPVNPLGSGDGIPMGYTADFLGF